MDGRRAASRGGGGPVRLQGGWWSPLLWALLWVSPTVGGCSPGGDAPPPPVPLLDLLEADRVEISPQAPGVAHYALYNAEEPWAVHLLRVELSRCELGLKVLEAPAGRGEEDGRSRVTELVTAAGPMVLAAVNGDFFTPEGRPVGSEVVAGEVRRVRDRPSLAWRPGGDPWMGTPTTQGDSLLSLGWVLLPREGDGRTQVLGGFPLLLREGARVGDLGVGERPAFAGERHPRTAVGFDADERVFWVMVVDGRQPTLSVGMTLPELAAVFEALGVEEAVNLDGGGSSVMVVGDGPVSSPSDVEGERPVANALGILRDPGLCRLEKDTASREPEG